MKACLCVLLSMFWLCGSVFADRREMRENIESEMPLEDAIADFNEAYPDANPLTVGEVVASIRHM